MLHMVLRWFWFFLVLCIQLPVSTWGRTAPPESESEDTDVLPVVVSKDALLEEIPSPVTEPMGLAVYEGSLWISDMATRKIYEFHLGDRKVIREIPSLGLMPTGLTVHNGMLIIADRQMDKIFRRRLTEDLRGIETLPYYEKWAWGMVSDGKTLWVVDALKKQIHQIDPDDGTTIRSFQAPGAGPTGIAWDGTQLWIADHVSNTLFRVDPETGWVIASIPSPGPYPSALVYFDQTLWVADYQTRKLYRIRLPEQLRVLEDDERRVRASYQVMYRASGTGKIRKLTTYLAIPREIPGQHILSPVQYNPAPTRMVQDRWGQEIAVFELGDLSPGETKSVMWTGDFALFRVRFQMQSGKMELRVDRSLADYLSDDKKYNLQHPILMDWLKDIGKEVAHPYRTARRIYEKLADSIVYDRSGGWNNAAAVLARKTGSCSEYTFALVALLRRAGLPARYVGAISERGDNASFDDVFHRWAEVWMPGYGWIPVDANAGSDKNPVVRGLYFGGRSNRHVVTTIGGGASEYLEWDYNHHTRYEVEGNALLEEVPIGRYRPLKVRTAQRDIVLVEKKSEVEPAKPDTSPCACPLSVPALVHMDETKDSTTRSHLLLWGILFSGLFLTVLGVYIALRIQNRLRP